MELLPLIQFYPRSSIIILALLISFFISLVNYFFLDKERMHQIKARQKEINLEIKKHQKEGNMEKAMALQKELFADMPEMFKHSLKPMLITLVPILLLFSFLKGAYAQTSLATSWFWYYLITAIVSSMVFRKVLKLP